MKRTFSSTEVVKTHSIPKEEHEKLQAKPNLEQQITVMKIIFQSIQACSSKLLSIIEYFDDSPKK